MRLKVWKMKPIEVAHLGELGFSHGRQVLAVQVHGA